MPRLAIVDPATDSGPGADLLNGPLKAKQINIFKGLAAHPPVLEAFLGWAGGAKGGALTPTEHELIALYVGQTNGCEYCTAAHTKVAAGTGVSDDDALEARRGRAGDDRHQSLLDFVAAMMETKGFVSDEQLQTFRDAGFDDACAIEAVAAISVNTFTNFYNHVNMTDVDFPVPAAV